MGSKLVPRIIRGDWHSVETAIARLDARLNTGATPTWAGITTLQDAIIGNDLTVGGSFSLTGTLTLSGLTASRLTATNAAKELISSDLANWVAGTANQITVTDDADGTITLATPQDIHTGASPTFVEATFSGLSASRLTATSAAKALVSSDLVGWVADAGTGNIVIADDAAGGITVNTVQDILTTSSPQFACIELGHATDTTITRVGAGSIAVEGVTVMLVGDAPTAHLHDTDVLECDGIDSDGGAFAFNTTGTVTFNSGVTLDTGADLTIAGHIIFNTNNSYIGFTNPRITFNDTDNTLDLTGSVIVSDDATIGVSDGTPSIKFDNTDGKVEVTGTLEGTTGDVRSGVEDTTRGYFRAYAPTGSAWGGSLICHTPSDSDGTITSYFFAAHDDDCYVCYAAGPGTVVIKVVGPDLGVEIATTLAVTGVVTWSGGGSANANTAYTHVSNNGTDHSYINQDVTTTASPTFDDLTLTDRLTLAETDVSGSYAGIIYKGTQAFLHDFNYGNNGTVTTDGYNLFLGANAGNLTSGSTATQTYHGSYNLAVGAVALDSITTGYYNTAFGYGAAALNTTGYANFAAGTASLYYNTGGAYNTAIGVGAGRFYASPSQGNLTSSEGSTFIGPYARAKLNSSVNEIVIGYNAEGNGNNTVTIGNTNTTDSYFTGNLNVSDGLTVGSSIYIKEIAAALADKAGYGQLWVKNSTPCELWFTDDAGTDTQIV